MKKTDLLFVATKIGEYPPFGPPTPRKVLNLFGDDKPLFLKGRQAENQGLGIGAFAYYRRMVDNQKNRLFDAIIAIAEEEKNADAAIIEQLRNASTTALHVFPLA